MPDVELKTIPLAGGDSADAAAVERPASAAPNATRQRRPTLSEYDIPTEHGAAPVKYIKLIHSHPRTACTVTCCGIFFWTVMCMMTGSISADKMTDVGLQMPDAFWTKRAEALYIAQEEANYTIDATACNRSAPDYYVNLVWKKEGENLLTASNLDWFANEVAKYSTAWDLYPQYCYISYADDDQCIPTVDTDYSDSNGCYYPQSALSYLDPYRNGSYDLSSNTLNALAEESTFLNLVSKDFSASHHKSDVLQAYIWLGTPNELAKDWVVDEEDCDPCSYLTDPDMDFIFQTYSAEFQESLEESELFFDFPGYDGFPVSVVLADLSLCLISIVLVMLYMWWYTNSLWITLAGMGQIFGCFFTAAFFYRWCWPTDEGFGYEYFNLFCTLSIFIILGIGADDIFVFVDTWNESAEHKFPNIVERLSFTYRSAGKAMLITSLTTAISFFTNLNSSFIGIRVFGVFAGLLVITNFIAMMIMFPCAMHLYDTYWQYKRNYCCLFISKCTSLCGRNRGAKLTDEDDGLPYDAPENPMIGWFKDKFAPFMNRYKVHIIAIYAIVIIVFLVFACHIKGVALVLYELLKPGYNFRDYGEAKANDFPTSANPMLATIVWGIDESAGLIDRGDQKEWEYEWGGGEVEWDATFRLADPSYQMGFYTTCQQLAFTGNDSIPDFYQSNLKIKNRGINPEYSDEDAADPNAFNVGGVQCFMEELRDWELSGTTYNETLDTFFMSNDWAEYGGCRNCWNSSRAVGDVWAQESQTDIPYTEGYWWPTVLYEQSDINAGCNCFGIWPVPEVICPKEFEYLPDGDRFRCQSSQYNFVNELGGWFEDSGRWARWSTYLFATPEMANYEETGDVDRFAMALITVELTIDDDFDDYEAGLEMADAWKKWNDDFNVGVVDFDPLAPQPFVVLWQAPNWELVDDLFRSAFVGTFLGLFLAWLVLVGATGNIIISSIAILNITCIVICILGFLVMSDWQLGPLESICCVLVVGFSVDYTVHLADSYMESTGVSRYDKTRDALGSTGVSVASGAVSTLLAALPMLGTTISFFFKFGIFLFLTVIFSILMALGLFVCMLMLFGPEGHAGSLSHMYTPYLERQYVKALEQERKEKANVEKLRAQKAARAGV